MICGLVISIHAQDKMTSAESAGLEMKSGTLTEADKVKTEQSAPSADLTGATGKPVVSEKLKESTVAVPSLDAPIAKKIVNILKSDKSVKKVRPDFEAKTLIVTYADDTDFDGSIMKPIKDIDADSKLLETKNLKATIDSKCGGCPHKNKCANAQSDTTGAAGTAKTGEVKMEEKSTKTGS